MVLGSRTTKKHQVSNAKYLRLHALFRLSKKQESQSSESQVKPNNWSLFTAHRFNCYKTHTALQFMCRLTCFSTLVKLLQNTILCLRFLVLISIPLLVKAKLNLI